MLSEIVWHNLVAPTTKEEIDSREKGCMQAQSYRGLGIDTTPPLSLLRPVK